MLETRLRLMQQKELPAGSLESDMLLRRGSNPTVFLGGPIQHAIRDGRFKTSLRRLVEALIRILEDSGCKVLSAHRHEGFGEMDVDGMHMQVASRDFAWMKSCDVFVAVLPNDECGGIMRTDGTCVELGWASALQRPIVVVRDPSAEHSHLVKGLPCITTCEEVDLEKASADPGLVRTAVFSVLSQSAPRRSAPAVSMTMELGRPSQRPDPGIR